ncbi:hypothetical protein [Pedobacter sp. WC2423]|uniref:hypothetical protein n=1 Tax=Pedobacter sp. WC2423 TaxID=3234142 RepID=UPI003466204D
MTDKQKLVMKGLLELSESERQEIIRESQNFKTKTFSEKRSLNESLEKAQRTIGPTSNGSCLCCGR